MRSKSSSAPDGTACRYCSRAPPVAVRPASSSTWRGAWNCRCRRLPDDLGAADLLGRHPIGADGTWWQDGPLTRAVREGGICYLESGGGARTPRSPSTRWPTTAASCT